MILGKDDPETIVQSKFFEGDVEGPGGLGRRAVKPASGKNR
jgi:hypothetical protein